MDAIGLNPIKLDAIGLDPIRMNAIRLGVPGASSGSARPYIDPDLLKHVKMAISTWGKSNDDPDRAILKDLSGNGNDMRLLNFGFAGNSGYGLYSTDFTKWTKRQINDLEVSPNKISVSNKDSETALVIWLDVNKNRYVIPSYKIKVSKLTKTITYYYIDEANPSIRSTFSINKEGTYILPISRNDLYNGEENTNIGFGIFPHESFTIEQLPDFEGWLCTDGVDDMIVSEKTVDEMIGDSKECTVISIINYISDIAASTNIFGRRYIRNSFIGNGIGGKYYICGYTSKNIDERGNVTVINDILGDKNDFNANYVAAAGVADYFSVTGYLNTDNVPQKCIKIAYAGGFIANKVLTTDEINQIIAYFNLDRPGQIIKPQLYCNVKKQGITNDNHAEFNDQLIDFVNGYNIQLNNIGWEGESGIGSYPVVFGANKTWYSLTMEKYEYTLNPNIIHLTHINTAAALQYTYLKNDGVISSINREAPAFKLKVTGLNNNIYVYYRYLATSDATTISMYNIKEDGIYDIPKSYKVTNAMTLPTVFTSLGIGNTDGVFEHDCNLTLEILPTIENALCLDGISDFGKATGLPVLKDYTVVALRKWLSPKGDGGGLISKSKISDNGAFIIEQSVFNVTSGIHTYSFGLNNTGLSNPDLFNKNYVYQTRYSYNGNSIQAGAGIDSDSMWLGTLRDGDYRFSKLALWSLMLFPYSLSEFLLERQLRKYKAGTLYPDMIEFRPIVKSNIPYSSISYSVNPGVYVTEGSTVTITITLSNASDKLVGVSSNAISDISISGDNGVYEVTGKVTKSPQKINIVISSYLTMLGNETLINN
ncbi:hypothetical protein ACMSE5_06750 [Bacteroides thetaiotaomicron]|uniref:hypothetical protein n=1 Tax=Bacteroides thetaiotaomicron TaxID=818 RepID=UPI0039C1A71B